MSFSYSRSSKSKQGAIDAIEAEPGLPPMVKEFLVQGLNGIRPLNDENIKRGASFVYVVVASGHLCKDDYNVSNCTMSVTPTIAYE